MVSIFRLMALVSAASACTPVTPGLDGNLAFGFATDDLLFPVNSSTPIGAGLSADILVYASVEDRQPMVVSEASASPSDIAEVASFDQNRVVVRALAEGQGELIVTAAGVSDRHPLRVAQVDRVELRYPGELFVSAEPPVSVLQGGQVRFRANLFDANGRTVIGYGDLPVTVEPASAGAIQSAADTGHVIVVFSELGQAQVVAEGQDPLSLTVVPPDAIVSLEFEGLGSQAITDVGVFLVRGLDSNDESVFGLTGLATVQADDTAICEVRARPVLGDAAYEIQPVAEGECTIRATLGAIEISETFEVRPPS